MKKQNLPKFLITVAELLHQGTVQLQMDRADLVVIIKSGTVYSGSNNFDVITTDRFGFIQLSGRNLVNIPCAKSILRV